MDTVKQQFHKHAPGFRLRSPHQTHLLYFQVVDVATVPNVCERQTAFYCMTCDEIVGRIQYPIYNCSWMGVLMEESGHG
jgi:hypothetical protein